MIGHNRSKRRINRSSLQDVAQDFHCLGVLYAKQGEDSTADRYLQHAKVIKKEVDGLHSASVADTLEQLWELYYGMGRSDKVQEVHDEYLTFIRSKDSAEYNQLMPRLMNYEERFPGLKPEN